MPCFMVILLNLFVSLVSSTDSTSSDNDLCVKQLNDLKKTIISHKEEVQKQKDIANTYIIMYVAMFILIVILWGFLYKEHKKITHENNDM